MNRTPEIQKSISMTGAYSWAKAVIRQGERYIDEFETVMEKTDKYGVMHGENSWPELNYIIFM